MLSQTNLSTPSPESIIETLWQFVRGDTPAPEFEQWVYGTENLETLLGPEFCLDLISVDFESSKSLNMAKQRLREFLEQQHPDPSCHCIRLSNLAVVDMGNHKGVFGTLEEFSKRGDPFWWLYACQCSQCGADWLIASEERQNDIFCLHRLAPSESKKIRDQDSWPTVFDSYETLLTIGRDAGRSVRFVDPLDSSLRYTIVDLAKERPGISVSELASLLNLDIEIVAKLATLAASDSDVKITMDNR